MPMVRSNEGARAAAASGGRVWVVDDSRLEAERLARLLVHSYQVEAFAEGGAMLERLAQEGPPDLILLDWQMPGVSGLEVCRFVRERHDEVSLPILMLTSRGAKEDFRQGLSAGANDYVSKPYDDAELVARTRTLVRTRQLAGAIRTREQWFAATLKSISDAVITTDVDGRVTFLNRSAESLTGWPLAQAIGRPLTEVFEVVSDPSRDQVDFSATVLSRSAEPPALVRDPVLVQRGRVEVPIEASAAPIGDGAAVGAVIVFRDVTERKRVERETKGRADFEEKLIGIVSHDLRSPLNAILLSASTLLRRHGLDERGERQARRIRTSGERATRLVGDLLDFTQARLGTGIPIRRKPVDLNEVAKQVADELRAAGAGRELLLEAAGDAHGEWDPDRVEQMLSNLVSNALQYGEPNAPVTIRTHGAGDTVTVAVHNRGAPISAELLPTLFLPMKRGAEEAADRSVGLGLYIVKHIIDAHGGTIDVTSSKDAGTTFTVRLPRTAERAR